MDLTLVLNGGADKAVSYIGALAELNRTCRLHDCVRRVQGTSAGALIGTMFCMGMSTDDMRDALVTFFAQSSDVQRIREMLHETNALDALDMLWQRLGAIDNARCVGAFVSFIFDKTWGVEDCTLADFVSRTGVEFVVVVSNLSQVRHESVDQRSDPTISMSKLLCMTTCIPLLFEPVEWNGDMFADGCLYGDMALPPSRERALMLRIECAPLKATFRDDPVRFVASIINGVMFTRTRDIIDAYRRADIPFISIDIKFDSGRNNFTDDARDAYSFLALDANAIDAYIRLGAAVARQTKDAWSSFVLAR
jgi:predicted acylesterase/phospholipase RssA